MMLDVEMEKFLLSAFRTVEYKYAILHGGGNPSVEFEFLPKKPKAYGIVNRELKIPSDRLNQSTGNDE